MLENLISDLSVANILFTSFALLILLNVWKYFVNVPKDLPPGPNGLPLVGYVPFIKMNRILQQYQELADKYGDIFSFYMGRKLVVVLNSYEAIKEALVKQNDNFSGRPLATEFKHSDLTFFNVEGEVFREHKRFSLTTLKDFGFGKHSLEPQLRDEVIHLLDKISSFHGMPVDIGNLIRTSVSNVICALMNGKRFDYEDKDFQKLLSLVDEHISRSRPIDLRVYFPKIVKFPGMKPILNFLFNAPMHTYQLLGEELEKIVNRRLAAHEPGQRHDFISAWFTEVEEKKKTGTDKYFTNQHLTRLLQALFLAGTDTTANSLRWSIMHLMKKPEIQAKVQNEIAEVIGQERMPSLSDQDKMPYTLATIMEVQRISSLVPLSLLHSNFEDTKLKNFTIPKRSIIVPNLWAVHHDPKNFPDPHEFKPERFLDQDGKLMKAEKLIPFSQGKRQCLGESLARMELFVYFTSLLQRFTFQLPEDEKLNFEFDVSVVSIPKPYKVMAIERKM